MIMIMIMLIID